MNTDILEKRFKEIGARVKIRTMLPARRLSRPIRSLTDFFSRPTQIDRFSINILRDKDGEFFSIDTPENADIQVVNSDTKDRHLLLMHKDKRVVGENKGKEIINIAKFLCGHDERHWFVAAIPETAAAKNVREAKEALKPKEVIEAERVAGVKTKDKQKRKNVAMRRQGEWMFLPAKINEKNQIIFKNEPIRRGRSKPHYCEFLIRSGGTNVRICEVIREKVTESERLLVSNGLTDLEYKDFIKKYPKSSSWTWRGMTRDAKVFVKGRITHVDHRTIIIPDWHQVIPNTESKARAGSKLAFLD